MSGHRNVYGSTWTVPGKDFSLPGSRCPQVQCQMILVLTITLLFSPILQAAGNQSPFESTRKNVLILHSYHKAYWTDHVTEGIYSVLGDQPNISFNMDFMDTKKIISPEYYNTFHQMQLLKYKNTSFDIVIASDNNALMYALEYQNEVLKEAPIVFCGVSGIDPGAITKDRNVTGAIEVEGHQKTLKTAIGLFPLARKIYAICDYTISCQNNLKNIRKTLEEYPFLTLETLRDYSVSQLKDKLQSLDSNSLLIFVSFWKDGNDMLVQEEQLPEILACSSSPVFGCGEGLVGKGIIGGLCSSPYNQGRLAGEMAQQILDGTSASSIPVNTNPKKGNQYLFDYQQLTQFNISPADLPEESTLMNTPDAFFKIKKNILFIMVALIGFMLFLILLLIRMISLNLSARRKLSESQQRMELAIKGANLGTWDMDFRTGSVVYDKRYVQMLGFEPGQFQPTMNFWQDRIHPDDKARVMEQVQAHIDAKTDQFDAEYQLRHKDGHWVWVHSQGKITQHMAGGKPLRACGIHQDITQRKAAETTLRQYEKIVSLSKNPMAFLDSEGRIQAVNQAFLDAFNKERAQLIGHCPADLFSPDVYKQAIEPHIKKGLAGQADHFEGWYEFPGMGIRYLKVTYAPSESTKDPALHGIVVCIHDLTDIKLAVNALEESESKFRSLVETSSDWIWEVNTEGMFTYSSPQTQQILGFKPYEIIEKTLFDLMDSKETARIQPFFRTHIEKPESFQGLIDHAIHKDGHQVILETSGIPFFDTKGNLLGYRGINRDVTERIQAENKLRENEQFLKDTFDGIQDGISVLDTGYNILRVNRWMEDKYAGEMPLVGRKCYQAYHKKSTPCEKCPTAETLQTGQACFEITSYEIDQQHQGWLELSAYPLKDQQGRIIGVIEHVKDITQRIENETQILRQQAQLDSIVKHSPIGIALLVDRKFIHVNDRYCEMYGYREEEILGQSIRMMYKSDEEFEKHGRSIYSQIREKGTGQIEVQCSRKDGRLIDVIVRGTPLDPDDWSRGITFTVMDITERKQTENKLAESEEWFRAIYDNVEDGILVADLETQQFIMGNQQICTLLGYPLEELKQIGIKDIHPEELYDKVMSIISDQTNGVCSLAHEIPVKRKDNSVFWADINSVPLTLRDKQYIVACFRDVSERKKVENALRESQRSMSTLLGNLPGVAYRCSNQPGRPMDFISDGCLELTGYPADRFIGKQTLGQDLIIPEDRQEVWEQIQQALDNQETYQIHYRIRDCHGTEKWLWDKGCGIFDSDGKVLALEGFIADDTERSRAEQALTQSEKQFRSIIESTPLGVHLWELREDHQLILLGSNPAAKTILGIDVDSLEGKTIEQAFPQLTQTPIPNKYRQLCREGGSWSMEQFDYRDHRFSGSYEFRAFQTSPGRIAVMYTDISQRLRAEQTLRFTQFAVDHAAEAAFWITPDSKFTYVNDLTCQTLGYSREELLNLSVPDIDPDFPTEKWPEHWQNLKQQGTLRFESHHQHKDGHIFPVEITANFVEFAGKEYNCAFARDITERKKAAEELEQTMAMLQTSLEQSPAGILIADAPDVRIRFANSVALNIRGQNGTQLTDIAIEKHFENWQTYHPDGSPYPPEKLPLSRAVLHGQSTRDEEVIIKRNDGQQRWVSVNAAPICDSKGTILAGIVVFYDITERKMVQKALEESEKKHRLLYTSANDGIFIMDELSFLECNPKAVEIYGCNDAFELIGKSPIDFSPEYQEDGQLSADKAQGLITQVLEGRPLRFPWIHHKLDGTQFYAEVVLNRLELGERNLVQAIVRDVTEDRVAEQAREQLLKELKTKNEELESIVFIASHDLRSPLVNIEGFTGELKKAYFQLEEMLKNITLDDKTKSQLEFLLQEDIPESIGFISAGTSKMDSLLTGLLRLSRIGTAELHIDTVNMNTLISTILGAMRYQIREEDIEVTVDDLPLCRGDAMQINQVFTNLIDNAMKYCRPNHRCSIHISGRVVNGRALYSVKDNGIGIESEHCEKIFEIFHRLNPAGEKRGEGLGLTIVRRILERQDGKIWVRSALNKGSEFFVSLPKQN